MVYLIREARHIGMALSLDSVRYYAIDIDVRNLSDYLMLKSQGFYGLSRNLQWLYSIFHPYVVRNMEPQFFLIVSRGGSIGLGEFKEVSWHKREKEDILKVVGVKCEYGELVEKGEYRGRYQTVGDAEHAEIIRLYVEDGLSINRIAERLSRSTKTVWSHIQAHNSGVERSGFCPSCRRVKSDCESTPAYRS
jgi:hypothetical protein